MLASLSAAGWDSDAEGRAVFLNALESVLNTCHNLLLFSTDSTTLLRKHLTKTGIFPDVLMPYMATLVAHGHTCDDHNRRSGLLSPCVCVCVRACVRACVRMHACVHTCLRECV